MLNWRRRILVPALRALRPVSHRELKLLRDLEWKSSDEIRKVQEGRLVSLLQHAWAQTDYYREVLDDCGAVRNGVVDLGRFEQIPFLTKDIIRREGVRLRAKKLPGGRTAYLNRTGGSSGEPIEYWQDNYYWDVNVGTKIYHFEVLGKRLGEPELKIWGSDRDLLRETSTQKARLQNFLYNRRICTCSRLTDRDIMGIVDEINRFRPRLIWGYIDGLYTVARYVNHRGLKVHAPAAVFGGGGTLFPQMGESIRAAFGAPAINFYGSREMGDVACECAETAGLHISSHSHKVEVVDHDGRPVVERDGELILTSLHNYAMPFIRYQIGDRGQLTERSCRCRRSFPLLESVAGRGMESFVTRDGAIVSPTYLITAVGTLGSPNLVKKIQFVQDDYSKITVRIVPAEQTDEPNLSRHLKKIALQIQAVMGSDCSVAFERVPEIPPTRSGKYLYTVCRLELSSNLRPSTALQQG
jgi:phenylacetate-CoA ligase